jgi:preflagellin peptidase FlaK
VFTNTVVAGICYPLALAGANLVRGRIALPMLVGKPVAVPALATAYGSLLETPRGYTRSGLDVDALRMYLRWRQTTLAELRADPDWHRDPRSLPEERGRPGDGAVADGPPVDAPGTEVVAADGTAARDPATAEDEDIDWWGAEAFLAEIDGTAYGTTPRKLRDGLSVVAERETVWLTPGIPFIVPMFVGLVVALTYGDVLFVLLRTLGVVP